MRLINRLKCHLRGHSLGPIEPDSFWFSTTCQCCGKTLTGDAVLELAMLMPATAMRLEVADAAYLTQEFSRVPTNAAS